jgi:hypothetical protein
MGLIQKIRNRILGKRTFDGKVYRGTGWVYLSRSAAEKAAKGYRNKGYLTRVVYSPYVAAAGLFTDAKHVDSWDIFIRKS